MINKVDGPKLSKDDFRVLKWTVFKVNNRAQVDCVGSKRTVNYLKIDKTAQRAFSGTYFDLKLAITGQNAPTQASNVPKSTSRTIGSSINATSDSADAEIVRIVTSVGLIKSLTSDPTITESISAEKIRP